MSAAARTVFFGTGPFAVPILETLVAERHVELLAVVTAPPRPAGRGRHVTGSPVSSRAAQLGILTLTPERLRDPGATAAIRNLQPELIVLADYGRLVPGSILDLPRHGALNLHPSLLPRHRGASPIQTTILAGDRVSGVTLMRMDEGMDTGPIVAQSSFSLTGDETAPDLEARSATLAAELLSRSIDDLLSGGLEAVPQPAEGATLTRPVRREDGRLDAAVGALELERRVRAYQPWPGAFVDTDAGRLAVRRARVSAGGETDEPGALVVVGDVPALATTADRLELLEVVPAGGRAMSGAAYLRGRPGLAGSRMARGS